MITNQENSERTCQDALAEEEVLLKRSSAPTLRDLRAAAKDLLATMAMEPNSALPNVAAPAASLSKSN